MLSVAIGLAETRGLKHVMIANHAGDHTIYPDCRPSFIRSMSAAAAAGTFVRIDIVAPFTDITKGDIALIGKKSGIDYTKTWSCYKGGEKQSCQSEVVVIQRVRYCRDGIAGSRNREDKSTNQQTSACARLLSFGCIPVVLFSLLNIETCSLCFSF